MQVNLKKYAIIGCSKCRELFVCRTDRKTFQCRKCGYRIRLDWLRLRALITTNRFSEALSTLQNFKQLKKAGKLWKRI